MRRTFPRLICGMCVLAAAVGFVGRPSEAQEPKVKSGVPIFQVEPGWLKLPEHMKLGSLSGLAVEGKVAASTMVGTADVPPMAKKPFAALMAPWPTIPSVAFGPTG